MAPATTSRLSESSAREFRKLVDVVDRTVPFPALDRSRLPVRVVFDPADPTEQLGRSQGATVTIFRRAFASSALFLYVALHEVGHVVFALLDDAPRAELLGVLGIPAGRWEKLVLAATEGGDAALRAAAVHEIRLLDEAFAEAYAEYWTKTEYLKARSDALYRHMRKLFWETRRITPEGLGQERPRAAKLRCVVVDEGARAAGAPRQPEGEG